jgi:predicted nucleotide-binding protein
MKIFIGSSSKRIETMELIASWVEQKKFTPLPWAPDLLPVGDTILSALYDVAHDEEVKGAIFIFGEDDKIIGKSGKSVTQPRDNVLIEYGLFVGVLGSKKAIICTHGKPNIATDLGGIIYVDVSPSNESTAKVTITKWLKTL